MNVWSSGLGGSSVPGSGWHGAHAVLSGRIRSRRSMVDEGGNRAPVTVLEIVGRGRRDDETAPGTQERHDDVMMLLLLPADERNAPANPAFADDAPHGASTMLVVDGSMRVCDLVRYASGVMGEES